MLKYIIFFIVIFIIGILIYRDYKDFYNSEKVNLRIKESFKIKENFKDTEKTKDENILLKAKNFLKDKIESVLNVSIEEKEDDFVDMIVDYYNNNSEGLENYKNKFDRFKSWLLIKNKNFLDKFEKLDLTEYIKDDEEIIEHFDFGERSVTAFTQMGIDKCSWVKRDIINQVKKLNKLIGETKNLSSEDKETQQNQLDEVNAYCNKVGLETCQTSDDTYEIGQLVETRSYNNEITQNYYTAYVVAINYETYCLDKIDGHPCLNDDNNVGYCEDGLCKLDITNNSGSVGVEENNKNSDNNSNILSYDLLVYGKISREINVDPKYIRRGEDIETLESSIMLEKEEINDQKIESEKKEAYANFNNIFSNLDVTSEKYDQTKYNYCLALKDYEQEASNTNTIIDTSKFEDDYVIEKLTYWKCDYVSQIAKAKDQFEAGTYDIYQYRYDKKAHNWIYFQQWLQEKCLDNINDIFQYLEIRIKDYVNKTAATFCTDRISDMQNEVFGDSDSNNNTTQTPTITTTERQKDQFDDELEIYYNNFTLRDKLLEVLHNICGDPEKTGNNYEGNDEDFTLILDEIFKQFRTSLDDLDSDKLVKTSLIKVCNKISLSDKIDWLMYQVYKSYPTSYVNFIKKYCLDNNIITTYSVPKRYLDGSLDGLRISDFDEDGNLIVNTTTPNSYLYNNSVTSSTDNTSNSDNVDTCDDTTTCEKEKNVFDYIKKVKNGEGSCIDETSTTTTSESSNDDDDDDDDLDTGISEKLFNKYITNLNALLAKMVTVCALPKQIHGWIYEYSESIRTELEDQILVQEKYDKTAKKLGYSKTGVVTNRPCYDFTQCDALGVNGPAERCCNGICTSDYPQGCPKKISDLGDPCLRNSDCKDDNICCTLDGKFNPNPGDSFGVCTVPCRTGAIRWCPKDPFKIGVCEAKLGEKCVVATDCRGWGSLGNYVSCCGGRCTDRSEEIESVPNGDEGTYKLGVGVCPLGDIGDKCRFATDCLSWGIGPSNDNGNREGESIVCCNPDKKDLNLLSFLPRDNDGNWGRCTTPCVSFGIGWCPAQPGIPECEAKLGTLGCALATDCAGWGGTESATSCCSIEGGDSKGGDNIKNNICLPMWHGHCPTNIYSIRDDDDDYDEKEIQFAVPDNEDFKGDNGLRTIKVQKENTCTGNRTCGIDLRTDVNNTGMDAEEYYGGTSLWCHYGKCQHMYVANNIEPTLDDTIKYLAKDCNKNSPLQVPAIKNEGGNGWAGVQCTGHYTRENLTNTAGPGQNLLKKDQDWVDYLGDINDQSMELIDLQCKYNFTKATGWSPQGCDVEPIDDTSISGNPENGGIDQCEIPEETK